ncbi:MAG: hypothetical protein D6732_21220 [Methanobacteriota archaeon]|nr:MAG: hypothetical protein D6732_21220 [Euryarchaeota archaeon]
MWRAGGADEQPGNHYQERERTLDGFHGNSARGMTASGKLGDREDGVERYGRAGLNLLRFHLARQMLTNHTGHFTR